MSDFLQINKIKAYLPPDQSEVKIGSDDPHSKDVLFTPNTNDPSTTGKWGELLNEGTFVEVQTSFKELKAFIDDAKPILDQLVDYTNQIDLFRKNNELKGFGIGVNYSALSTKTNGWLNIHGYDPQGLPTQTDGWFYYQQDELQSGENAQKLVKPRQIIKQKSFGTVPAEYESDLLLLTAKYNQQEAKWIPFLLAVKEERITDTDTQLTVQTWDKSTEGLTTGKTVATGLKYPNHSIDQYKIKNVFAVTELGLQANAWYDWESTQNKNTQTTVRSWDSINQAEKTTTGQYANEILQKEEILVLGVLNLKVNAGQVLYYNAVTFLEPITFDQFGEDLRIKKQALQAKVKAFTESYGLFKKIQLEIENRVLDTNTVKADIEQKIREFIIKKKDNELLLEYFNNTHDTPYDVLPKGVAYPSQLNNVKRVISAPLIGESIKETWLHGTNSSKVLRLGQAGQYSPSQTVLETGFLTKGQLQVNGATTLQGLVTLLESMEIKKQLTVRGNVSIPTAKLTAHTIEATNQLISNTTVVNGTLTTNQTVTMNKPVQINDNLTIATGKLVTVHAQTIINGLLNVNNNVVLNSAANQTTRIKGITTLEQALTVQGVTTLNNNVTVATAKKLTTDLTDINTLLVKLQATIQALSVTGTAQFTGNVSIPTAKLTVKDFQSTGTSQLNILNVTGQTTTNNTSLGVSTVRETLTVAKGATLQSTLNVTGTARFDELVTANNGLTIPLRQSLITDLLTARTAEIQVSLTSLANTVLNGTLTVNATTNHVGTTTFTGAVTTNQTVTANFTVTTNQLIARQRITAQADIQATGEIVSNTNVKAQTVYQRGQTLDDTYLRKFEGSTGVACLNVPRETKFLIQRNVTNQIDLKRATGYDNMQYNDRLNKFEYGNIIRFYPGTESLNFKDSNNIIQFDEINYVLQNLHLFIAFDIKEQQTIEKTFLTLVLADQKKVIFKLNPANKVVVYLDSTKLFEVNVFKDVNLRREVFGVIFKDQKIQLVHDGSKLIDQSVASLNQNQQIKSVILGSVDDSLIFDLYTLMLGQFTESQWEDIIGSNQPTINYQYSQEVYQCFGKFKYNENLDRVNFALETASLPIATLQQKGIVQLTNIIEDREDIAVTPRALIDFNVQNIYQQKYFKNLKFNIKQGITDTVNEVIPYGYNSLNLQNCKYNGEFDYSQLRGKIVKQGLSLSSNSLINYELPTEANNWFFIFEWTGKQLSALENQNLNLFKTLEIVINTDFKTLESDYINHLVVHASGKYYLNGELIKTTGAINNLNFKNFELYSALPVIINRFSLFENVEYNARELVFISKYGFETEQSIESAPLSNTKCNWNQLKQIIDYTNKQIDGVKEKLITKTLPTGDTTITLQLNYELYDEPKFYIDGSLLIESFYTWNEHTKEFKLKDIVFTQPKEITIVYKYRVNTDTIIATNKFGCLVSRDESQTDSTLTFEKIDY